MYSNNVFNFHTSIHPQKRFIHGRLFFHNQKKILYHKKQTSYGIGFNSFGLRLMRIYFYTGK